MTENFGGQNLKYKKGKLRASKQEGAHLGKLKGNKRDVQNQGAGVEQHKVKVGQAALVHFSEE